MPVSPANVTQIGGVIKVKSLSYEGIWLGTYLHLGAGKRVWIRQIDVLKTSIKEQLWNTIIFINKKKKGQEYCKILCHLK